MKDINICLVDDESDISEILSFYIKKIIPEAKIVITKSAQEALKKTQEKSFFLSIVDYQLPDMNGLELIKLWFTHEKKYIPKHFLVFSGFIDKKLESNKNHKKITYLSKPLDEKKIESYLHSILIDNGKQKSHDIVNIFTHNFIQFSDETFNLKLKKTTFEASSTTVDLQLIARWKSKDQIIHFAIEMDAETFLLLKSHLKQSHKNQSVIPADITFFQEQFKPMIDNLNQDLIKINSKLVQQKTQVVLNQDSIIQQILNKNATSYQSILGIFKMSYLIESAK